MEEYFYTCPYCFSEVSVLIDTSQANQQYIEDCERCCNPTEFTIEVNQNNVAQFSAETIGQ